MIPALSSVTITYPPDLPVSQQKDDIAATIRAHQVVIVAGATGSGKTTQLPKILLELGRESIGHTQPRRIAARTIAERIAEELGTELGGLVGYQVRFTDTVGKDTRIKLMTDGILLNEIHRDRMLKRYDTIIIDEAHERSLTVDFLLGYLKQLLPKRPELKLIITSATIDPESFARHFTDADGNPAPIVEVSGRSYPVEIRYRPLTPDPPSDDPADDEDRKTRRLSSPPAGVSKPARPGFDTRLRRYSTNEVPEGTDLFDGINAALDELARESNGDVLVFLSGENEIRDAEESIRGRNLSTTDVLPLYGRLSAADQHRVFGPRPAGIRRRVVLATNVAETSLTVPGIRYVIDAGTARISRYSVRSKIQRLPIEAISQASANQRSGRSGRTSDGIAIRLYSEEDFLSRPEFTEPEILRTNLAAVILQMISLGLGEIEEFPFLQPPDSRGVKDGLELLRELGAVSTLRGPQGGPGSTREGEGSTQEGEGSTNPLRSSLSRPPSITKIGRQLAGLPIDPRLGRMVIESGKHGVTREVMAIVAALSIQDPRERPLEKRAQADQSHARFTDKTSDFLTLLNLWDYVKRKEKELSSSAFRRLCKAEYLNFLRIREWGDVYRQLTRLAKQLGLTVAKSHGDPSGPDAVGIHRSLLAGLLSQIGIRDEQKGDAKKHQRGDYLGARQVRFAIFPGSALAKKQPAEIMSAELVETSRLFARVNAAIDLTWAEPIAGDLAKRSYSEPHWEKKQGSAVVYEKVTLYGVPIVARRRVQLARIDAELARELFIRSALVEGDWNLGQLDRRDGIDERLVAFDRANRGLRRELAEVEERTRRRDILYDDEAVFGFYDRVLPPEVTDQRAFESWWKKARAETPDLLTMRREDLLDDEPLPHVPLPDEAASGGRLEGSYPDFWHQGDQRLTLTYRFEPGADDDGVTVRVPIALLPRLSPAGFDWQVPGLREELVVALIKSLPKAIRRNVVPAAQWATRLLQDAPQSLPEEAEGRLEGNIEEMTLREFLAAQIQRETYTPVSVDDFDLDRIPDHLRVTFAVIGENGRQVAASKDLEALQHKLKTRTRESVAKAVVSAPNAIERGGLTNWDFEALPGFLDTKQAGNTIRAYPALADEGATVAIRLMATPTDQAREHRHGVLRMLQLAVPSPTAYVQEHLTAPEKLGLARSPYPSTPALFADCMLACADAVLGERDIRSRPEFESVRDELSASILDAMFAAVSLTSSVLAAARDAEKAISAVSNIALIAPLADAREQLDALVFPGFVARTGLAQLRRVPVYLAGIHHRVEKLAENLGRDRVWMSEVQTATERYRAAGGELPQHPDAPPALVHARWLLEELRLSLFAQHLGTSEPVSLPRITKLLATL